MARNLVRYSPETAERLDSGAAFHFMSAGEFISREETPHVLYRWKEQYGVMELNSYKPIWVPSDFVLWYREDYYVVNYDQAEAAIERLETSLSRMIMSLCNSCQFEMKVTTSENNNQKKTARFCLQATVPLSQQNVVTCSHFIDVSEAIDEDDDD